MLVEDLTRMVSAAEQTKPVLLYFSKAFDKVNHSTLLEAPPVWNQRNRTILGPCLPWEPVTDGGS